MQISIIIPVLNEQNNLLILHQYLLQNSNKNNIAEILFIDGGSTDNSLAIFNQNNLSFYTSEKGRAKQMNFGAKKAKGELLYFLHVDSFPPKNFDSLILEAVKHNYFCGCFKMKFNSNNWFLKFFGWLTQFSFKACRGGDQSLFVTKKLFEKNNGFNENKLIYEDNELIFKLIKNNPFKVIQQNIVTSARKYHQNGIYKLQVHFGIIHLMHLLRFSDEKIFLYYHKNIK